MSFSVSRPTAGLAATTAAALGFYGGAGASQPSSYTTNATIGSTRVNAVMGATTFTSASFTLVGNTSAVGGAANAGFNTTANLRTFVESVIKLTDDVQSIKQWQNAIINDLKAWNLSG